MRTATTEGATMTPPTGTENRAIVDTHRHPIGSRLAAKMAERDFCDPKQEFPQTNAQDLICYRRSATTASELQTTAPICTSRIMDVSSLNVSQQPDAS